MIAGCGVMYRMFEQVPAKPHTTFIRDEHTLYMQDFDETNGTDETAKFGEYSHGPGDKPVIIKCDEIGLVGSMQYTVEFWWLPPEKLDKTTLVKDTSGGTWTLHLDDMIPKKRMSKIKWGFYNKYANLQPMKMTFFPAHEWVYIARTGNFQTGEHFLHVNGVVVGAKTGIHTYKGWQNKELAITNDNGFIDGFRVSNIVQPIYIQYNQTKGWVK